MEFDRDDRFIHLPSGLIVRPLVSRPISRVIHDNYSSLHNGLRYQTIQYWATVVPLDDKPLNQYDKTKCMRVPDDHLKKIKIVKDNTWSLITDDWSEDE